MRFVKAHVVAVSVISLIAVNSFSSEVFLSLDRSLTSAPGHENTLNKAPFSASVVTKEDIEMTDANQTTDILGELPGIFVKKTSALGRADVDIRGIGSNGQQIGVFIDGRPEKMGIFGCAVTQTLPMNNVEKIEVIRGPESVLYGSDALSGVINIVTRRATKSMEGSLQMSYGTFNTQDYLFQQGSKLGKFDYYVSVNKQSTDGHIDNTAFNGTDFSSQFGYALTPTSDISLSAKYFTGISNIPATTIPVISAATWNDYGRGSVDLTYKNVIGDFNNSLKVYRSFGEHKFSTGFHSTDYTNGAMLHTKVNLSDSNELSMGTDYRYQAGDVLNWGLNGLHKYEYGIFANDAHTFFEQLTFNAGARYNYDEFAKDFVTPEIGVVFDTLRGTILRASVSQGFRSPQLVDMFFFGNYNPNIKPEKVTNGEVGIRQKVSDTVDLDITEFRMRGSDLFQTVGGITQNVGSFEFNGTETMLTAKLSQSVNGQINYTYFNPGTQTTGRPGDKAGASLKYAQNKLSALLTVEYVGKYFAGDNATNKIDDYLVFNAKIDYLIRKDLSVFTAIDNITNQDYQILNGNGLYMMPKSTVSVGMKYIFG